MSKETVANALAEYIFEREQTLEEIEVDYKALKRRRTQLRKEVKQAKSELEALGVKPTIEPSGKVATEPREYQTSGKKKEYPNGNESKRTGSREKAKNYIEKYLPNIPEGMLIKDIAEVEDVDQANVWEAIKELLDEKPNIYEYYKDLDTKFNCRGIRLIGSEIDSRPKTEMRTYNTDVEDESKE